MKDKGKLLIYGYVILIFLTLLIFFIRIHPLIIYDTDDWLYISYARKAIPLWGNWNPSRILPEIMMPFLASLGVYLVYPFTHDYIGSIAFMYGLALSICITIYIYLVMKSLIMKTKVSLQGAVFISGIFLLLHFLIFRSKDAGNVYMLHSFSSTNYFYYTIPTILNISLVLLLILKPQMIKMDKQINIRNRSLLILAIYFCIFSNLFSSYILAIWAGTRLLFEVLEKIKSKNNKVQLKDMTAYFLILGCWLLSMIYELSGGRADSLQKDSYIHNFVATLKMLISFVKDRCNGLFIMLCVIAGCMAIIFCISNSTKEEFRKMFAEIGLNLILSVIYILLVCAKTSPDYICRTDVLLGISFWLFYGMVFTFGYGIKGNEKILLIMPLLMCIMFS